ncbi:MAG: hypothetical protein QM762_25105 [Chryseolinea sp.]
MRKEERPKGDSLKPEKQAMIRACTLAVLAALYGVSIPTFKKMIKPHLKRIGERVGNLFTTRQILTIVKCIGPPAIMLPW